jgi:hypothetical protein
MYFSANLFNIFPNLFVLAQFQRFNVPRPILYDTQWNLSRIKYHHRKKFKGVRKFG